MPGVTVSVVTRKEGGGLGATIHVRLDAATLARVDRVGEQTLRKRSDVVRQLLMAGLELQEKGAKK